MADYFRDQGVLVHFTDGQSPWQNAPTERAGGAFNEMLDKHLCIAIFLPMIIGSGGNAGNQPGVMVTQALSEGQIERAVLWK